MWEWKELYVYIDVFVEGRLDYVINVYRAFAFDFFNAFSRLSLRFVVVSHI